MYGPALGSCPITKRSETSVVETIHHALTPCFCGIQRTIVLGEYRVIGRYGLKRIESVLVRVHAGVAVLPVRIHSRANLAPVFAERFGDALGGNWGYAEG